VVRPLVILGSFGISAKRREERARIERLSIAARRDVTHETAPHLFQIANLALDPSERIGRPTLHNATALPGVTPQRQQVGDLLERESQILSASNESNALNDI
jgi:ABC-type antimicrobial peptide transport system ATPase subunit